MKTITGHSELGYRVEYAIKKDGKVAIIVNGNLVGLVRNMEIAKRLTEV